MYCMLFHITAVVFKRGLKVISILNLLVLVNPVRKVIDALKYAYHHKYPVRRSALSYYLNTYLSRIDFGKVQYGGFFTNEEVEDTKNSTMIISSVVITIWILFIK